MKAMIFAAGLGTRLRPLTNDRPKALVEVGGMPLLEITIKKLIKAGVTDIIINVHHFADKIVDFLRKNDNFGVNIVVSHEVEKPLETGGGLKKAAWFLAGDAPFFVCNADILSNIDLKKLYAAHQNSAKKPLVTYAVQQRDTSRYMLHDTEGVLCGWFNAKNKHVKMGRMAPEMSLYSFSCFHVIDPAIFSTVPEEDFFTVIDWYLGICAKHVIECYQHSDDLWCDIGKPETLLEAEKIVDKIIF